MSLRILVAGGAGFIGSHLCERLLSDGHEVICLDNFSTGRKENVARLLSSPRFEIVRHDLIQPLLVEVDQLYNLACPASPAHYQADPVRTVKTNVLGALHVLDIALQDDARVLLASTSEVYGDPEVHPQPESYRGNVNCTGVRACYDEGKRVAETLFFDYERQHGVDVRVARLFNTFGPRMHEDDGRVVSAFIVRALRGEPLTVHGDGSQTRSFCYIDDLVEGMVRLMADGAPAGPVNLGNPEEVSVRELAERVLKLTSSESRLQNGPRPADDPSRRCPDISFARKTLGWNPRVSLDEGLRHTIDYFRARLHT